MIAATHIDLYQLTSLIPHWDAGLAEKPVAMSFFSRRLPRSSSKEPVRGFLLWVGLRRCLEWLTEARFTEERIERLLEHPMLGSALKQRPGLVDRLRNWQFRGRISAPPEGTPIRAGLAKDENGQPLEVNGTQPAAQTPYLLIQCDMLSAKLIETPLLSVINHMTMVGSKAAHIVLAAGGKGVLEFGTRRTHPQAAVDAAYAGWIAGCTGTSNVEAHCRYGVPVLGTMDHFAIQAWERAGVPRDETELAYFRQFYKAFPDRAILLVDTYDTYGEKTGIRNAVKATDGNLRGIRLDSRVSHDYIVEARQLLDQLGANKAMIVVSGGLDEHRIRELSGSPVDAYGIGERMVTSPDAPVGVGAVGKLCLVDGEPTMKVARGSGKASLPGLVQVYRQGIDDIVVRATETRPGQALLHEVWRDDHALPQPEVSETRDYAIGAMSVLKELAERPEQPRITVSRELEALIRKLVI